MTSHLSSEGRIWVFQKVPELVLQRAAEPDAEVLVHVLVHVHVFRKKPEMFAQISTEAA